MSDERQMVWMIVCRLNAHHFYALTICNMRELAELQQRIGDHCVVCGGPIDSLDVATAHEEEPALHISRSEGSPT